MHKNTFLFGDGNILKNVWGKKPRHLSLGKVLEDFHYQASSGDEIVFNHVLLLELVSSIFF